MQNGIRLQLGCVMAAEGLLNGFWSALGGLRCRKKSALERLLAGPRGISRQASFKKGPNMGPICTLCGGCFDVLS